MKALLEKVPADLRDIFTLFVGNSFSMFIPVLVSPIISRMYGAGDFGTFTIYLALLSLVSSFATGRYDYAILITKSRYNAQHLFKVALLLASGVCAILLFSLLLFEQQLLSLMNVESMGVYIYLLPLNIILFVIFQACQNALNREKLYKPISISKTLKSTITGAVQVVLGFLGFLSGGLIVGKLSGELISSSYLAGRVAKIDRYFTSAFSLKRAGYLMKKYEKFLKVNAPHALVNNLSLSVTPILIGYFFDEDIVGYYGLSYMVCIVPVQLIGRAFYQVVSQKVSEMFNEGTSIRAYVKETLKRLFLLSVVPFSLLTIFGPQIFEFVFGEQWYTSGQFVQILAPFLFVIFMIAPLTYIPLIYNEHNKSFYFEIALFVSRVIALVVGAKMGDIYLALILFSTVSIVVQSVNLMWIYSLTKRVN
ncbi:lipopolysaccharide biosynthesis protein [Gracilimonas sp.]|uniref:lipopolysaccharide biosynthesis protein n=1 Tax=Gracilimonas sp. TaxID=1974203 RepID=UPI003BAB12E6